MIRGKRPASADEAIDQVWLGSRILAASGYEDLTLGHLSVRGPEPSSFYIKRKGMRLGNVTRLDVARVAIDDPEALRSSGLHLETVMHQAVYKLRPDVGCVIHGHPIYGTSLGSTDAGLAMASHDAVLFHDGVGLYGVSADLITTSEQGQKVAEALGQRRAALLKNHGVILVGQDVRWAVLAALTLERAIRVQAIARSLGNIRPIAEEEAEGMFAEKYQDGFLDEYWSDWVTSIEPETGSSERRIG